MKKKIAVLGLSHGYKFAQEIKKLQDVELVAVAGNDELAKERAIVLDVPLFDDYKKVIECVEIDGAIIALPNHLHLDAVRKCAKKQIDVLVEKPIASTAEEGSEIVRLAKEANIQLLVGHHRRFSSKVARLKNLLDKKTIGDLVGISMFFTIAKDPAYFDIPWRVSPSSGGPLLINVAHDIDTIRYVTDLSINSIYAVTHNKIRKNKVEDTASILFETEEGVVLNYFISDGVPAPWSYEFTTGENPKYPHYPDENCYFIFGTKGSISFPSMKKYTYEQKNYGWDYPLQEFRYDITDNDPIRAELVHFISVLKGETTPLITGEDALETLKVILATKQSALEGTIVKINN